MLELEKISAVLFDLDGVIVDTAKYHYLAWKHLAEELGFEFGIRENEKLKGVSRSKSLENLLEAGGLQDKFTEEEKLRLMEKKNEWYIAYIEEINHKDILEGAEEYLLFLKDIGIKTGLGSASKNASHILKLLGIEYLFDVVVDGTKVSKAKPHPEVFMRGAEELHIPYGKCLVVEDAEAGICAAHAAGMQCIGIGDRNVLKSAELVICGLKDAPREF